jgi:two-component system, NarL family, nitrate/nitrite response regulator NarL
MRKSSSARKIRVAVVDDHPMMRRGVSETLSEEPDLELVGTGASAEDALRLARQGRPDLMLLDIALPGGGIEAAREIVKACPDVKVVFLTVREDRATVNAALRAGARGYIVKGVEGPELVSTLRRVNSGQSYVTPALAAQLLAAEHKGAATALSADASPGARLTAREQQIVERLGKGLSNQEIAEELDLTESTIKHYMTRILQKLGFRNRTEAAIFARTRKVNGEQ